MRKNITTLLCEIYFLKKDMKVCKHVNTLSHYHLFFGLCRQSISSLWHINIDYHPTPNAFTNGNNLLCSQVVTTWPLSPKHRKLLTFPFRTPSEHATGPTNPADLQDFFNRIFKGGPPNDMAANGGFFPSGPPHHPPGAGAPPFSPPPGQTGFHMPGAHRPESSETWAESGKPPRRRKKVRKPFQRWSLWTSQCIDKATQGHNK